MDQEDCHFKFRYYNWDANSTLQEVKVKILCLSKQSNRLFCLCSLSNLRPCLYFEHIVRSYWNTYFLGARSWRQALPYTTQIGIWLTRVTTLGPHTLADNTKQLSCDCIICPWKTIHVDGCSCMTLYWEGRGKTKQLMFKWILSLLEPDGSLLRRQEEFKFCLPNLVWKKKA